MFQEQRDESGAEWFQRDELILLRDRAGVFAEDLHLNRNWRQAFSSLAEAADRLDAMLARATIAQEAHQTEGDDVEVLTSSGCSAAD